MFDIITVGSNLQDVFVHTDKEQTLDVKGEKTTAHYLAYPVGSKLLVTNLLHNFGGNGMNAAVSVAKFGLKTGYVGKTGLDATGDLVIKELKKNKITFLGKRLGQTGTSIILDAAGEDRTILTFKGCNNDLKIKELNTKKIKAKAYYFSSMLGESLNALQNLYDHAKKQKALISFNPSQTMIEKEKNLVEKMLKSSNVFACNKEEAEMLIGKNSIEENLKIISSRGPKTVVITDGKNGAQAIHNGVIYSVKPRNDLKILETTGAGDAFASAILAGLILKKPFETCLKLAINNSESVISGHGAQNGLLTLKQLTSLALKDKRRIEVKQA